MHRTLTLPLLLACLLAAAAAVVGTQPWAAGRASGNALEVRVDSDQSGIVQLYYDLGQGYSEGTSVVRSITAGEPATLRFELPYGHISSLRLDPIDRDARVAISGARIVGPGGAELARLGPERFHAWNDIASTEIRGGDLVIVTKPGATDPNLSVALDSPLQFDRPSLLGSVALAFAALVALVLAGSWAVDSRSLRLGERWVAAWGIASYSPGKATALVALLATVWANYPVIFAGKSLASPGLGVAMLYGQNPWLPRQQSAEVGDPNKSDVAALLWHHLPLSMIERRAVLVDHELPLWNRFDSAGVPLLGQGQSCFGDPLQAIPVLADGASWAWDLKFMVAKWLFACGVGLCAWRCFRHLPTALVLAASSAFVGFFIYRINHPAIFSLCYAPWILFSWVLCTEARSARAAILALSALIAANWTEMNSGTAKEAYVLLFTMNFSGLCVLALSERRMADKARLLLGAIAAGGVFALVGSPVWYTFYRALKASYTSYNAPLAFQIQPGMLVGLFDEAFYRPFQLDSGVANPSANFLILTGLLWGIVRMRALWADRRAAALLVSSLPALALVYGVLPPGFIAGVPFLGNILHVDNTFSCALIVILGVLSGFGLRDAWERLGTTEGRREAGGVLALAVILFVAYAGTAQTVLRGAYANVTWGRVISVDPFVYAYGASLLAGVALLLGAGSMARRRGALSGGTAVCLALALGIFHWRQGLKLGTEYPTYVVRPTARLDLTAASPAVAAMQARDATPYRALGFYNDLLPGWSIVYGIEGISGPDALVNPLYRELLDSAGVPRVWDWRYIVKGGEVARLRPTLDSLGVRYYLGYHLGDQRPGAEVRQVISADMDVYESASAWPRAFFTDSAAVYKDVGQFASWVNAGDGRPFAAFEQRDWAALRPQPLVSGDLGSRQVRAAEGYRLTTNTTSFTVTATGPGFIVLTEAYEKGNFRAWLNGARVPYVRANHAFKAIYVDRAGKYDVRFAYWPQGFSGTLACFFAGMAILLGALLVAVFVLKPRSTVENAA
jgi:hypothetical protein